MNKTIYILSILLFSWTLAGCSSQSNSSSEKVVVVWHWMGDRQDTFDELANRYQAQTGTEVRFDLYAPSEAYTQKVKAAAQTQTLPDIFGILGDTRDFASFIKSGYVAEISGASDDGVSGNSERALDSALFQRALSVNEFKAGNVYGVKPGLYGIPLDMTNAQFIYNKDLFRKAGLDPEKPPVTWNEYMAVWRELRAKDIPVLVSGFGEIWLIDILATGFAMNIMGEEKVYDTYRGKVAYTDPDWIRVLEAFNQMTQAGVFASGTVTMVNKTAEQTFANGRAAFAWNGSWSVNVYKGMNPKLDYGVILPPRFNPDRPVRIWGGPGNSFMVNNQSPRKAEAMNFLIWMAEKEQQTYLAESTHSLPSNKAAVGDLSLALSQFADDLEATFHMNTMPAHESPRVVEAWNKGIQSIIIGEKTPEEVAREVQEIKIRMNKS